MPTLYYDTIASPIGKILIAVSGEGLFALHYPLKISPQKALKDYGKPPFSFKPIRSKVKTAQTRKQLKMYFQGKLRRFNLALDLKGTAFQKKVWKELLKIPFGQTTNYGEMAKRIKAPQAARAVGMANNKNGIGIVIPCHRVIGSNGKLTGYAAGLGIKNFLLNHERRILAQHSNFQHPKNPGA